MDTLVNRRVGEFDLVEPIGTSDMTVVYRAYQPSLRRYVALKVLTMQLDPRFERRFKQEAEVLTSLEHPHIVPIYHYGVVEAECAYIAMRLMHGSLEDQLSKGPFPAERVTEIALQLIDGLNYAHKKGVIHHDIKPANIMFDEAGSACLTDFGISNVAHQSMDMQRDDLLSAAPYAAPEQIRNASTDHRSDIYSLGVIMYQMLTGVLPFERDDLSIISLLRKIEHDEPIPPRSINPEIPVEIERVVLQALRKEPRERFFDASEMVEALQATTSNRPNMGRGSSASLRFPNYTLRRQGRTPLIFGLVVLITMIALLLVLTNVARENSIPHIPTVIAQTSDSYEAATPTSTEIARAQQRLGASGFIAYIACSLDSQFQATRAREMGEFAETDDLDYRVYDSDNDIYTQLTMIERARLEGARGIILCPMSPHLLEESLRSIQAAGIPLVLTASLENSYGGVMLSLNDYEIGRMAGEYIGRTLSSTASTARVIILTAPDALYFEERVRGFTEGVQAYLNTEIVATYPTGTDRNASQRAIKTEIQSNPDFNAIFSVTDSGAYGASAALREAGTATDAVRIASVNAESLALDEIYHSGYLRVSIDIARESGSRGALNAVVKLLGGGTLPERLTMPTGIAVTREMMAP